LSGKNRKDKYMFDDEVGEKKEDQITLLLFVNQHY